MQIHQLSINLLINNPMRRIWKRCFSIYICFKVLFFYSCMSKI